MLKLYWIENHLAFNNSVVLFTELYVVSVITCTMRHHVAIDVGTGRQCVRKINILQDVLDQLIAYRKLVHYQLVPLLMVSGSTWQYSTNGHYQYPVSDWTTGTCDTNLRVFLVSRHIVKTEGVPALFKGLGPTLIGIAPSRLVTDGQ